MHFKKAGLIAALMLGMFLAAVEGTIVTMAMPTIAKDLHGFTLISLVFSVYLLTSAISTPIYGKFADLYGRKKTLTAGILIFLAGSCLCGLSQSMAMLIACRALQGLGAGAIFTVPNTIIGDVFSIEERSMVQGGLNTLWGISSLAGPFLGGFLIDALSWHWIFLINLPFGLLSVLLLQSSLKEDFGGEKHRIDYAGAAVLSLAVVLILGIFLFGRNTAPGRCVVAGAAAAAGLLLFAFYRIERRAREPMVSFEIFNRSSIMINGIAFLVYAALIGVNVYMPIYLQDVLGLSPTVSGLSMLPMSVAWLLISLALGKLLRRHGEKAVTVGACVLLLAGLALLPTLGPRSPLALVLAYGFVLGLGFGGVGTALTIIVQDSADYSRRGSAVAANTLFATLGQTIGVSVFGGVFNGGVLGCLAAKGIRGVDPAGLLSGGPGRGGLSEEAVRLSLSGALHVLFLMLVGIAALSLAAAALMPRIGGGGKAADGKP